ncbi:MAG: hypothetical protein HQL91_01080 [Magnetococcales bacterium]|nr:hypothetical protein [Magnetococcales bacterium]
MKKPMRALPCRRTPSPPWLQLSAALLSLVMGCAPTPQPVRGEPTASSTQPLPATVAPPGKEESIPGTVKVSTFLPKEGEKTLVESTYTVVVTDVPVREVLFALARDAHLNVDIVPGITGNVTVNAIDQTLPRILDRIAYQARIRYQIKDNVLSVEPDLPFRRNYRVDYVSTARKMESDVAIATNVASTGGNAPTISNSSSLKLGSTSTVDFWKDLIANLNEIVAEKSAETAAKETKKEDQNKEGGKKIIWNEATGVVSVLATERQHQEVGEFIDRVLHSAQRQVLIEATVAEVNLSDQFQTGIDWSMIKRNGTTDSGNRISLLNKRMDAAPVSLLTLNRTKVPFLSDVLGDRDISTTLHLLANFGKTKVLSSPRITVLNNQTAVLRVTTNEVYFQIRVSEPTYNENGTIRTGAVSETQIRTVPLGFIMQVTPQISESDVITLNIRPTIQRVEKWVDNPDPNLRVNLPSNSSFVPPQVPVVQVQEMDSVLRVPNGHVAVMGGLMENSRSKEMDGIPLLSDLPVVGGLFSYRDQKNSKSELVVFLRPVVTNEPRELMNRRDKEIFSEKDTPFPPEWVQDPAAL